MRRRRWKLFGNIRFMRLRPADFAARRINWADKGSNLRELPVELNIGLDSFVDDNPAERELILASLPEVYVPEWPKILVSSKLPFWIWLLNVFPGFR